MNHIGNRHALQLFATCLNPDRHSSDECSRVSKQFDFGQTEFAPSITALPQILYGATEEVLDVSGGICDEDARTCTDHRRFVKIGSDRAGIESAKRAIV